MAVKCVGLTGNPGNALARKTALKALHELRERKIRVQVARGFLREKKSVQLKRFDCDLALAFGGDGSLLHAFRELGNKRIPVLGVNCGGKGFLMQSSHSKILAQIPKILLGRFSVEKRARLSVMVGGRQIGLALNEAIVSAAKPASLLRYSLLVNGKKAFMDAGDGLIVATPTGSTAYSLSAGGPVVKNNAGVFVVNPLNSMLHANRLVVSDNSTIMIEGIPKQGCELVLDGQLRSSVKGSVEIRKAEPALFAVLEQKPKSRKGALGNAAPSAKFVFRIIRDLGSATKQEIIAESSLPERTVKRALDWLLSNEAIVETCFSKKPRQILYSPK